MEKQLNFNEIIERSLKIRQAYHQLEQQYHGSTWTVEEDALAYLTDAGLVGRLTMAQQGRWLKLDDNVVDELSHKLSENIWWLIVLADRMDIDLGKSISEFLDGMEKRLIK
ncbi:MazG-like protein [Muribacter muris]|uniref:MazG-like protein n=1 Tax=Muribacter muris TaxID=67855 RepID=A0A4Y9K996_9PAST|nr:MazG-like protein [Muribacter muris]MBF0784124.1 MazG-like protein [Muribacter muris]MBF0827619.1 MazG-like protein [Muribacter muris]TFV13176.1 MazG-like protein [Muribacter muris]